MGTRDVSYRDKITAAQCAMVMYRKMIPHEYKEEKNEQIVLLDLAADLMHLARNMKLEPHAVLEYATRISKQESDAYKEIEPLLAPQKKYHPDYTRIKLANKATLKFNNDDDMDL